MVEQIKLGRIGHYHIPNDDSGSCQTGIVVKVWSHDMVNVVCWEQGDGDQRFHSSVPVVGAGEEYSAASASFHLNRDCPFER